MIFNDCDVIMNDRLDPRIRQETINKYKLEATYYAVIEETLRRYGIAPPPAAPGTKNTAPDGRDIANMDISALGCARDEMAMRLSDLYASTGGKRGVGYGIEKNATGRTGKKYDITVAFGNGVNGALSEDQLKAAAADAFMNCEPLYQMVQTHLASETLKHTPMTDEELAAETDKEMRRMLDPNERGSVMQSVYEAIESMSDETAGRGYGKYSMAARTKRNKTRRIYQAGSRNVDDIEIDAEGFRMISKYAKEGGEGLIKKGSDKIGKYVEFTSPYKESGYGGRIAAMIKISPLMPEMAALRAAGAFSDTLGRNGFVMLDTQKNMIVPAPAGPKEYDEYASMPDTSAGSAAGNDEPLVLGLSDATGAQYIEYRTSHPSDSFGYDAGIQRSVFKSTIADNAAQARYDTANAGFKARMIELLESHSVRSLNDRDIETVRGIFDNAGRGATIFGTDWDEISENADAYFDYIEHVCAEAEKRMSSHELEIHFENTRQGGFAPILYITGERTDDYMTAKSNAARFIAVYPYTDYYANSSAGPRNPDVCAMMGDVELPSRDGYRIANADAHSPLRSDPYFRGTVTADMAAEMRKAFDAYVLNDTEYAGSIEVRKISRAGGIAEAFDAADFVDGDGNIRYDDIRMKLVRDREATKNIQRRAFERDIEDNIARFDAAVAEFAERESGGDGIWAAVSGIFKGAGDPESISSAKKDLAARMSTCALHAVRDSLDEDRNGFAVKRHIFMNYASEYAERCAAIMADGRMPADAKKAAIEGLSPIRDDEPNKSGARKTLERSLRELFGYDYKYEGKVRHVIKPNTCKYMSTQISSYDDYEKLLALLSHSDMAEYEPDKLKRISGRNAGGADITIQLFSSDAYDAGRAGELDDDDANDDYSNAGTDYGASFDDEIWYAGTFAKISDDDYSYAYVTGKDGGNPGPAIFRATHPLQHAALLRAVDIIRSREGDLNPEGLKITPQGIIYYDPDNDGNMSFKIGPVLDEKAYVRPVITKAADYDPGDPDGRNRPAGSRLAEIPVPGPDGNPAYDDRGIMLTEKAWVTADYGIRIGEDGEVENPISFGALDTEQLIGGNGAMNRFYGVSAKIGNYGGYGHDGAHYADRAEFRTYHMGVLDNLERQLAMRYIARDTSDDLTEGRGHNRRMARAAAYCEIGGGTLMKCYRTNTYILADKTACRLADSYMRDFTETMRYAADGIPEDADSLPDDNFAKRTYDALRSADMDAIDEIFAEYLRRASEGNPSDAMDEMFGEYGFDINIRLNTVNSLYGALGKNSRNDPQARKKYRQNANLIAAQAEMNRDRVIMGKVTLDQNIGLKEQANNLQQAMKGRFLGGLDRKSMRNTDALSARVALFGPNGVFDPEYSATAKQLGAVAFLQDNIEIDRITGETAKNGGAARCALAARGVADFASGGTDCRYVRYPKGKALDRAQLSMNAIEKSLGYATLKMAMASAWYNMEDGYIISKRAAAKLGHFDANGEYIAAKEYDKIGDSEAGNKGIISKIVDTDIESEPKLKEKLVREYIQDRRVNGKPMADGGGDEELGRLLRRYDNRYDPYGNPDEPWDDNRIRGLDARKDRSLDALYAAAYDYVSASSLGLDSGVCGLFNIQAGMANYPQGDRKPQFMRDFARAYLNSEYGDELRKLLDGSLATLAGGGYDLARPDGSEYGGGDIAGMSFEALESKIGDDYGRASEKIRGEADSLLLEIADHMSGKGMQPWSGHYAQEKWLWQLFEDNKSEDPDECLDVVVTDACVNTRSNPALMMYIADDGNNTLKMGGNDHANAMGAITVYLDSHLGDDKNTDYTGNSNKRGRAIGAQEMYMMDAKNANGAFMKWIMLNDPAMPGNIARYNRKLMMNGFVADVNNGLRYTYLGDMIEGEELEAATAGGAGSLAYISSRMPGTAFVDIEELARPIAEKLLANGNIGELTSAVADLANKESAGLNFTKILAIADGRTGKEIPKGRTAESEDNVRNLFASAFGSDGGNFMLLPEGMSGAAAEAWHEDRPRNASADDEYAVPLGVNGESYDDYGGGGYDDISPAGYESQDSEPDGKFKVTLHADVKAGGRDRRAVPLFMSSYESVNDDTETVTSRTDDRLQLDIFKRALACALIDAIESKAGGSKDRKTNELEAKCAEARSKLSKGLSEKYRSISEGRSKTLDLSSKMPHYLKKKLYRMSFPKSLTCVWHGNPNIEIDEAGLSFESAKKLGYLRPKKDQPLSPEELKDIPDDYEHMLLRYEPVGPDDFVWVNRSPGQTTGCARMLRLRITGQSGKGLMIHPAVATIFDGDFDGDTVGVANPMHIAKGSALEAYAEAHPGFRAEVLKEIRSSMTMSANLVKTADYADISIGGKNVRAYPLFIAGNADVAIARANMRADGRDIDKELERITVAANIAEQAKQMLNDGRRGNGRKIAGADASAIRRERAKLIKEYAKYIEGDKKAGERWQDIYRTAGSLADSATGGKIADTESAEAMVSEIEKACAGMLRKAYSDMEGYVSAKPCFTRGRSELDMACRKIEDANINKKGKAPQLNALLSFGGMHADGPKKHEDAYRKLIADNGGAAYGFDVAADKDKKFKMRAKRLTIGEDGDIRTEDIGFLGHDPKSGELSVYDISSGDELPDGKALAAEMTATVKWDDSKAKSDTPPNSYRSESELNASAQACKSDATGIGGAVAQKFQMMLSAYGYGELGLRISGPITQKYLDAKQNVTMCSKNLKIGKAALDAVCKFQYVRELSAEYNTETDAKGRKPDPGQVYNGHFTVDPKRPMTIGEGVAQLDNLLRAIGQPGLTAIDKRVIASCVHAMQKDYDKYAEAGGPDGKSRSDHSDEKIRHAMKDMYAAIGDAAYSDMYAVRDGMHARKIADEANRVHDGKEVLKNSVFSPDLKAMESQLSNASKAEKMAEAHARNYGSAGGPEAPAAAEADQPAEEIGERQDAAPEAPARQVLKSRSEPKRADGEDSISDDLEDALSALGE